MTLDAVVLLIASSFSAVGKYDVPAVVWTFEQKAT
jgi:hypothetical protein